jgi:hypothetical protein
MTAVTVMPTTTASPMSSRCSVSRVETVPRTRPGIAANASARHAAARRMAKPARTASDPPAFSSPSATAGSAAAEDWGFGEAGAVAFGLASMGGACASFAGFAGLGFFAGFGGFLDTRGGSDSEAGGGAGVTVGEGVAGGGAGGGGGAGSGTGAGSGAGWASPELATPRMTATAIGTTRVFAERLRNARRGQRKGVSSPLQGSGARTGRRDGSRLASAPSSVGHPRPWTRIVG